MFMEKPTTRSRLRHVQSWLSVSWGQRLTFLGLWDGTGMKSVFGPNGLRSLPTVRISLCI